MEVTGRAKGTGLFVKRKRLRLLRIRPSGFLQRAPSEVESIEAHFQRASAAAQQNLHDGQVEAGDLKLGLPVEAGHATEEGPGILLSTVKILWLTKDAERMVDQARDEQANAEPLGLSPQIPLATEKFEMVVVVAVEPEEVNAEILGPQNEVPNQTKGDVEHLVAVTAEDLGPFVPAEDSL